MNEVSVTWHVLLYLMQLLCFPENTDTRSVCCFTRYHGSLQEVYDIRSASLRCGHDGIFHIIYVVINFWEKCVSGCESTPSLTVNSKPLLLLLIMFERTYISDILSLLGILLYTRERNSLNSGILHPSNSSSLGYNSSKDAWRKRFRVGDMSWILRFISCWVTRNVAWYCHV